MAPDEADLLPVQTAHSNTASIAALILMVMVLAPVQIFFCVLAWRLAWNVG